MAKKKPDAPESAPTPVAAPAAPGKKAIASAAISDVVLRQPSEVKYADELTYLKQVDTAPRPFTWWSMKPGTM